VSQIARTIAKVLRLHEELTEAIALAHDVGHTPFGHAGERVLQQLVPGGFNHYEQSLRIVDRLERDGEGLNLTWEVRDGIARHSKGKHGLPWGPTRAPGVDAGGAGGARRRHHRYVNHDIDDATRAGILRASDLPAVPVSVLGRSSSERIGRMVTDVVQETLDGGLSGIRMSDGVLEATLALREFLFGAVYENVVATAEFGKAESILGASGRRCARGRRSSRPGHPGARRSGRGGARLRRGHDRPLRRAALRAPVHPDAVGGGGARGLEQSVVWSDGIRPGSSGPAGGCETGRSGDRVL